jgi:CheY-like chemotaxis protein
MGETMALLRASLPPSLDLKLCQPSEPAMVSGVSAQLQQVILNLGNNAAQAMDHVGRIELEIGVHHITTTQELSHGVLVAGRYVSVAVSDSGRGIGDFELQRIFEPFFTTRVNGNRLGLVTTQEIVREHGGAINMHSVVGAGTRFEVWLPRLAATPNIGERSAPPFGRDETVLVMETDLDRLLCDEEIFAALGYEPVGFICVAAACRASRERFDIAVVSNSLPTRSGLEVAGRLHDIVPTLTILLATAGTGELAANALVGAGISDVVPWPITAAGVAVSLQSCLQRRGWQAP